MKSRMMILLLILGMAGFTRAGVIMTGIMDGDFTGGLPKAVELYVYGTEDLTGWTVKNYNFSMTPTNTTTLSGTYTDEFVYVMVTGCEDEFALIWGNTGDFANIILGAAPNHNGDDAVVLHDPSGAIIDIYGVIGADGTGTVWDCIDSYAYKNDEALASAVFNPTDWTFGGANLMASFGNDPVQHYNTVPFGTYVFGGDPNIPDPNIPTAEYTYGWEDGSGQILYAKGNVFKSQDTTETFHGGSHALNVSVQPTTTNTSKAALAWVKNLQAGNQVTVKAWVFDAEPQGTGFNSTRIVADYANSADITEDYGIVAGGSAYPAGTGWEELETTFTFYPGENESNDAMLISAIFSVNYAAGIENYYIDDITVVVPEHATVVLPPAYDPNVYDTHTYGWENFDPFSPEFRETVLLGTFYSIQTGLEIGEVHSGTKALWVSEDGTANTAQGYIAWITGLEPGDYITASCFGRSYAGQATGGVRMWAHYTYDGSEITSYAGSAGGHEGYSDPNEWTEFSKMWVLPITSTDDDGNQYTPNGMVIEVRTYSNPGQGGFVDDLTIEVTQTAAVTFPSMDGDAFCVGGLPSPYDYDNNCKVDLGDLVYIMQDWLKCNLQPAEDCGL